MEFRVMGACDYFSSSSQTQPGSFTLKTTEKKLMTTMDAKGIAWVGNIYQKFEAMCLEVEEMMYEDTIKYVENQVVTVGESFKKFYSDVIQEILPPSSVDTDEMVVSDMPVQKQSDVEAFKKSNLNKKSTPRSPTSRLNVKYANSEPVKKKKDSDVIAEVKKDVIPASISERRHKTGNFFTSAANAKCMRAEHFDSSAEELVIKRNLEKKKLPPSKTPVKITRRRDACMALSSIKGLNKGHEVSCNDVKKLFSVELARRDSEEHSCHEIVNGTEQIGFASNSSCHIAVCDKSTSEKNIADELTVSSADLINKSNGPLDQETHCDEFSNLPEIPDAWFFCAQETEAVAGSDDKTENQINKLQLEQSCVVVNEDDFHYISQAGANSRPSMNKIRQAFSSSRKSTRKQEYKQLAVLHGNSAKSNCVDIENRTLTSAVIHPSKSIIPEACESEWELL